jgi:hypothetical protein
LVRLVTTDLLRFGTRKEDVLARAEIIPLMVTVPVPLVHDETSCLELIVGHDANHPTSTREVIESTEHIRDALPSMFSSDALCFIPPGFVNTLNVVAHSSSP